MPRKRKDQQDNGQQLSLKYIPLGQARQWERNPKKHDMGAIVGSIEMHGFKDPAKFEPTLNNGEGGLVEGNGRMEALAWMYAQEREAPRGVAVDQDTGEWQVPVLFGVDAPSQMAAESYALDHNNLVMAGGDFTAVDMMNLWEERPYAEILTELVTQHELGLPVSVSGDDLDLLTQLQRQSAHSPLNFSPPSSNGHYDDDDQEPMYLPDDDEDGEVGGASGGPKFFDATKLPDAPQGKTRQSYLLYVAFFEHEHLQRALTALSLGKRNGSLLRPNERFAQMDGSAFIDNWEEALKDHAV